jgi:hypothetical protein
MSEAIKFILPDDKLPRGQWHSALQTEAFAR